MTKKMLRGIAIGIIVTTLIFAYNFYFTNNFIVIKESSNDTASQESIEQYLLAHNLVAVDTDEYNELLSKVTSVENEEDQHSDQLVEEETEHEVAQVILFIIDPGTSSGTVGRSLVEKGLIDDHQQFERFLINNGLETKIKAGEYELTRDMSLEEIVRKIT